MHIFSKLNAVRETRAKDEKKKITAFAEFCGSSKNIFWGDFFI
jgi:hypothetical protein